MMAMSRTPSVGVPPPRQSPPRRLSNPLSPDAAFKITNLPEPATSNVQAAPVGMSVGVGSLSGLRSLSYEGEDGKRVAVQAVDLARVREVLKAFKDGDEKIKDVHITIQIAFLGFTQTSGIFKAGHKDMEVAEEGDLITLTVHNATGKKDTLPDRFEARWEILLSSESPKEPFVVDQVIKSLPFSSHPSNPGREHAPPF